MFNTLDPITRRLVALAVAATTIRINVPIRMHHEPDRAGAECRGVWLRLLTHLPSNPNGEAGVKNMTLIISRNTAAPIVVQINTAIFAMPRVSLM